MSYTYYKIMCPRGEIGRHKGLKTPGIQKV